MAAPPPDAKGVITGVCNCGTYPCPHKWQRYTECDCHTSPLCTHQEVRPDYVTEWRWASLVWCPHCGRTLNPTPTRQESTEKKLIVQCIGCAKPVVIIIETHGRVVGHFLNIHALDPPPL